MDASQSPVYTRTAAGGEAADGVIVDDQTGTPRPLKPEEGGAQSGPQIDESEIEGPREDHSPTTENDVT